MTIAEMLCLLSDYNSETAEALEYINEFIEIFFSVNLPDSVLTLYWRWVVNKREIYSLLNIFINHILSNPF
ncbi:hypothetical protein SAMN05216269_11461 [Flavobacterium xinjiangense]|uniref:Uncharacterized protein n=1 Tax=Flavobacterium xinjiangense TaxID=178356 RepID=A0A1M7P8C7_9FLAO|nr:hypothetical protein SAMN05216269_11461 [Flavobacterium xinjiangense]